MSVRRSLLVLLLLLLVIPPVVFSASNQQRLEQQRLADASRRNLQLHTVGTGRVESVVSALGTIDPDQLVRLGFLTQGRVRTVHVQVGDFVFAGEPLISLDDQNQRIAYEQAILALDRAQLELETLLAPVSEDDIRLAQAAVDSAWGAYLSISNSVSDDDLRAAELSYQQALAAYESLKAARDQAPGGFGSPAYNQLDAQTGAASFNAEIARLRLESLRTSTRPQANAAYARVVQAQRELDRVQAGPPQSQIDSAALNLKRAESQLRRAETALNRTVIYAPFDGLVSSVLTEVGSVVVPGVDVIELTVVEPLRLTVRVDEVDIRLVREGLPARIEFDALPELEVPGRVERIALRGVPEGGIVNFQVDLTVSASDPRVRVGMTAEANIITEERENVLVVPNLYIRRQRDRAFVNIARPDNTLEEVEITLGVQGREQSEVISGLSLGDVIAIDLSEDRFSLFGQ